MKIFFIMPIVHPAYQIQIGALSAFLKRHGHEVGYIELRLGDPFSKSRRDELMESISVFSPDIVGFSSYDSNIDRIRTIADFIKENINIPIIVGGYYATLSPEEVITYPTIDLVCVGEGEIPLLELLYRIENNYDISDIQSLYVKIDGKIYRNKVRNLMENLDELPFVDRTIVDYQKLIGYPTKAHNVYLVMMASRGCPFNCSYCSNHAFKRLYENSDKYVRYRTSENVIAEIEESEKHYKFNKIDFCDDVFTVSLSWLTRFGNIYKKKFSYPFRCNIRPENANIKTLRVLKDMGCEMVAMGLEAGDEKIRKNILRRNISDRAIVEAAKNIKKIGLKLKTYNMVGIPHETIYSLMKTVKLNMRIAPNEVQTLIYYPLKGTDLGKQSHNEGWIDYSRLRYQNYIAINSVLKHKNIPRFIIILLKWINSLTPLRGGNLGLIKQGFKMFFSKSESPLPL